MPESILKNRDADFRKKQWLYWFEKTPLDEKLYVVTVDQTIVGFCCCKPCEDPDAPDGAGEMHAAYVMPEYRGGIVGPVMIVNMGEFLLQRGYRSFVLWAFRQNRVRMWYGQIGFKSFVQRNRSIAGQGIPEIGYVCHDTNTLISKLRKQIAVRQRS